MPEACLAATLTFARHGLTYSSQGGPFHSNNTTKNSLTAPRASARRALIGVPNVLTREVSSAFARSQTMPPVPAATAHLILRGAQWQVPQWEGGQTTSACGGIHSTPVVVSAPPRGAPKAAGRVRLRSTREHLHRPRTQTRVVAPRF